MTNLTTTNQNLPATLEDLSKFVLIGQARLDMVRAEIRAIRKAGLAKEVITQKEEEMHLLSETIMDAAARFGELSAEIPKAQGTRTDLRLTRTDTNKLKSKKEIIESMGLSQDQVSHYEMLAANPDLVERAKAEAREKGEAVTQTRVLDLIHERNVERVKQYEQETGIKNLALARLEKGERDHERSRKGSDDLKLYWKAKDALRKISADDEYLASLVRYTATKSYGTSGDYIEEIDAMIDKLARIRQAFVQTMKGGKHNV
jgi:hypothetical protein